MQQKKFTLIILLFLIGFKVSAAEIRGKVSDKATGELLVGCTIYIENLNLGTSTGLDGSFVLKNVPKGKHQLTCSYISYSKSTKWIEIDQANSSINISFELNPQHTDLEEIFILGITDKSTEKSARASERNAENIINVMSSKAIELSPDLNVANVIQRMSGVNMERNSSGEAQYAILRGMDKRYNYTLVNGIKIPSPDNKHRYVPLDIFPSELLDRIEVTKSLTADMEGDATGGVVNMLMKDAPAKLMVQANAALGYNSWFIENNMVSYPLDNIIMKSPREQYGKEYKATMADFNTEWGKLTEKQPLPNGTAGLAFGNRLLSNRLGFIVAANYQNFNKGNSNTFYNDEMIQTEKTVRLTNQRDREYFENQARYGFHAKADYRISNRHKIEWYNAYISNTNKQVRQSNSINFKLNYNPSEGFEDRSYETRIRTQIQSIYASTLQGKHRLNEKLFFDWSAVYSVAKNRLPDLSHFDIDNLIQNYVDNIYVDADGSTRRWEHNSDRDYSGYLNFRYETNVGQSKLVLKSGGLFRDKKRQNDYVNYRLKPVNGNQQYGIHFTNLEEIEWTLFTPSGSVGPLVYDANEQIGAAYLNSNITTSKVLFSLGLRAEHTNQGYYMHFPNAGENPSSKQIYTDILPSAQIKYSPNPKVNWKASYFKSLNRPGFFEVVPYQIINEDYNEFGNKELQRAIIDNIDLRWEYFPKQNEQILIGVFYKNIDNPIEYAYFTKNFRQYGYGPVNLGDAQNLGIEIDVIKFMRNFGIRANYTFTHSAITTPKAYYGTDENQNYKRLYEDQTRPLVGQAKHVANLSLLYKSTKNGWDAQLASSYLGERISIVSHYLDSDYWNAPSFQLDASLEKRLSNGVSVFAKINNIVNSPDRVYIKTSNPYNSRFPVPTYKNGYTLIRENIYGRMILLGIRYKIQ